MGGREPVEGDGAPREMETVSDYARGDARGGGAAGRPRREMGIPEAEESNAVEGTRRKPRSHSKGNNKGVQCNRQQSCCQYQELRNRTKSAVRQDRRTQPTKPIGRHVSHTATLLMPARRLSLPAAPPPSPPWAPKTPTKQAAAGANTKDASIQRHPRASPSSLPPPSPPSASRASQAEGERIRTQQAQNDPHAEDGRHHVLCWGRSLQTVVPFLP